MLADESVLLLGVCFNLEELHPSFLFLATLPVNLEEVLRTCREAPGKDFKEGKQHWLPIDSAERIWSSLFSDNSWVAEGAASVIRALEFLSYQRSSS